MLRSRGVTLIELMIALAITMIMMGAVVTLFANMTNSVTDSRAVIEVTEQLRNARDLLQGDLAGHTAPTIPPLDPGAGLGFLELTEGLNYADCGSVQFLGTPPTPYIITYSNAVTHTPGNGVGAIFGQGNLFQANSIMGDIDDVVHLTVRSAGKPFVGRVGVNGNGNPIMMESQTAEIIWYALPTGRSIPLPLPNGVSQPGLPDPQYPTSLQLYTLYRRVLLVLPGINLSAQVLPNLFSTFDVSCHLDSTTGIVVANTLGDLTKRENRFWHFHCCNGSASGFPFQLYPPSLGGSPTLGSSTTLPNSSPAVSVPVAYLTGSRLGEDVVLDNVLAFDVRVFDPLVEMSRAVDGTAVGPSDVTYVQAANVSTAATGLGMLGGFVDMAYFQRARNPGNVKNLLSYFSGGLVNDPYSKLITSGFPNGTAYSTYDTWSTHYDHDGADQDTFGGVDQGVNGLDDPGSGIAINGVIDDPPIFVIKPQLTVSMTALPGERETMPPYPFPLRAMQVILRVYEPDSRQVRQVTVTQDFVPE